MGENGYSFGVLVSLMLMSWMLGACADATARATKGAARSGFVASVVQGSVYRHQVFVRSDGKQDQLLVFIDGDGSPWTHQGRQVSHDPTPRNPLALQLALHTPGSVLYVGRPCHFSARQDPACTPSVWTSDRYSAAVVASMAAVVNRFAADAGYAKVVLIGYSGGGALSVLAAPQIPAARAVITIAADLDVQQWSDYHGYARLDGSLNPATQASLDDSIVQRHLIGGRDRNVPESASRRYLAMLADDQVWRFPNFDHVCCWREHWRPIWRALETPLGNTP